jgi:hypothetical protein
MFVTRLSTDHYGKDDILIERPSWERVKEIIEELEKITGNCVCLEGPEDCYMGICGGEGQYLVGGKLVGGASFILAAGPNDCSKWITIDVGGQPGEYAPYEIVPLDTVLAVARTFFESGECDTRFRWNDRPAGIHGTVSPPRPLS